MSLWWSGFWIGFILCAAFWLCVVIGIAIGKHED